MSSGIVTPSSAARVTGMARIAPDPSVADLVEQHWIVTWDSRGAAPISREVLPDPCVNLAVEPGRRLLYGVGEGHAVRVLEDRGMVIGTKFRPGGFSGLWPGPVPQLTGRVLTLPEAFGPAGEQLDAELLAARDVTAAIDAVTVFVRRHRPEPDPQRELAMEAAAAMRTARPETQVAQFAQQFAVSPRTLQRLFARHVGVSPKQVLQRHRRQQAVDRIGERGGDGLARIAVELGYADQAHLSRDFRATLGRGPAKLADANRLLQGR